MKKIILIIGLGILISCYLTFAVIWFTAYFNGYEVLVGINWYKEAKLELIMWIFTFPLVIAFLCHSVKSISKQ